MLSCNVVARPLRRNLLANDSNTPILGKEKHRDVFAVFVVVACVVLRSVVKGTAGGHLRQKKGGCLPWLQV